MAEDVNAYSPHHPHEPEVAPVLDPEGRCLVCAFAVRERQELDRQIGKLAKFIMEHVEGEPSQSQGAVDTAIRLLEDRERLRRLFNTPGDAYATLRIGKVASEPEITINISAQQYAEFQYLKKVAEAARYAVDTYQIIKKHLVIDSADAESAHLADGARFGAAMTELRSRFRR